MEEIILAISSLAGACTAVALDKIPKVKRTKQVPTVNSVVEHQLQPLKMEKEILSKTISRLHQQESGISGIQKDKLLVRYQHQFERVTAKIEQLEIASKYPDFGPVGDSLISLMDNRLSQLDKRLHEISSKISVNTISQTKQLEKPIETREEKPQPKKIEPKLEVQEHTPAIVKDRTSIQEEVIDIQEEKPRTSLIPPIEVPHFEKHRAVELSTLTEITNKTPRFPTELIKPPRLDDVIKSEEIPKKKIEEPTDKQKVEEIATLHETLIQPTRESPIELTKPEPITQEVEKKIQLPTPMKILEEEKLEDDDKDLDKIKNEIMKALSKLEQVEVE